VFQVVFMLVGVVSCDGGGASQSPSDEVRSDDSATVEDGGDGLSGPDGGEVLPEDLYPGEPGAVARFDLPAQGFFDQPFPSDLRRTADGRIRLDGFPNPYGLDLLDDYVAVAEKRLDGFSPNGAIYFRFDSALDPSTLPKVEETLGTDSPILLVNVTEGSEYFGETIPLESWYWDRESPVAGYYLEPYLLVLRPLGGFPMRPAQKYACIVTRRLKDAQGRHIGRTATVADALDGNVGAPLAGLLSPLGAWLDQAAGIGAQDVAVATVFTTADPVREMLATARFIREDAEIEPAGPVEAKTTGNDYLYFVGKYKAPNFQTGEPPYKEDGAILFDSEGEPVVQWTETITFALAVPKGPKPVGGWPIVMCSHGTGGSYKSCMGTEAVLLTKAGMAVIAIDQPLHGDRYTGPPIDVEYYSFNFTNPDGARSLFRQAGLDFVALARFIEGLKIHVSGQEIGFNTDRIGYFGHSQGGLTGSLYVAVQEELKAAVLSGSGGGLAYTILLRKELDSGTTMDIKAALEKLLSIQYEDEFTLFHPAITLAQTLVDVADPINYSPFYYGERLAGEAIPVLLTEGVDDPYTPAVTTDNQAIAGGIPPLAPLAHPHPGFALRGLDVQALPAVDNVTSAQGNGVTAALAQYKGQGHFVAFQDQSCQKLWVGLLKSALVGGKGTLGK
jgi:hypothetical protein